MSKPRTVRLEVDYIITQSITKIIEVPEAVANSMIGGQSSDGWDGEKSVRYTIGAEGKITRERSTYELDTIDVLSSSPPWEEDDE